MKILKNLPTNVMKILNTLPKDASDGVEHKSAEGGDTKVWTEYDVEYAPIRKSDHNNRLQ